MDIREEFETWIDDYGWSIQPDSTGLVGRYEDDRTQLAWQAWQASRKSLVVELPEENPMGSGPGDHGDGRPSFEQHCAAECNFIIRDCRDAIHNAGIRTK